MNKNLFALTKRPKQRRISENHAGVVITILAPLLIFLNMQVDAQDDNDGGTVGRLLEEITVTATKKQDAENLQDVPLSITAFNEDTLDSLNFRNLQNLTYSAPNVSLDGPGTVRTLANFTVRGLAANSSIPSVDPTVGTFVDGVYLGTNYGVVMDMFDIDSIEILRGPQGILFGRNTTGGAVVVNTGNPTDEFQAKFRAAVEGPVNEGRGGPTYTIQGVVSGPIVEGRLNGKIAAYHSDDDGYFENLLLDENHGGGEMSMIRGALEFLPTENLRFLGKIEYSDFDGTGAVTQNRGVYHRGTFDLATQDPGSTTNETLFTTLRTDLDVALGDGTITNIFGYRDLEFSQDTDFDGLALPNGFFVTASTKQEQVSNELRYAGTFGATEVRAGFYYFEQDVVYSEMRNLLTPRGPLQLYGGGGQDHEVLGVFAAIDHHLTEKIILSAGARYTNEKKDAAVTYIIPRAPCDFVAGTCPTRGDFVPGLSNGFEDDDEWSNWTPKAGVQYVFSDNARVFFNYTKGFRSGGYNFRVTAPVAFEQLVASSGGNYPTDEEEVDSFELGFKFQTQDGRGTLNATIFRTKIEDMQRETVFSSATAGSVQTILNTADTTIDGIEVEGRFAILDNLMITGNLGLMDGDYDELRFDLSGDGIIDAADLALDIPRLVETSFGIGAIHDLNLGDLGLVSTRVNYQYRDRFGSTDSNLGWVPSIDILNANITWNTPLNGVQLSFFGRNLLDNTDADTDAPIPFGGAFAVLAPGGQNFSTGLPPAPYAEFPSAGTITLVKKGLSLGVELTVEY